MSNELIPTESHINAISFMAKSANSSKFYNNLGGEAGIMSIMLLARELNVPVMQAISGGIWNIQGKVEMSARMMNMKIRQAGHKLNITSNTNQCTITGKRKDTGEELTVTFTMEDASRAGLSSRDTWKKNPDDMLFARCLSKLARRLFPDVIGNCYVEGEIRESLEVQQDDKKKKEKNETIIKYETIHVKENEPEDAIVENSDFVPEFLSENVVENEEKISLEQLSQISDQLVGHEDRYDKLLGFYKITDLKDLPAKHYNDALTILKHKNRKEKERENVN